MNKQNKNIDQELIQKSRNILQNKGYLKEEKDPKRVLMMDLVEIAEEHKNFIKFFEDAKDLTSKIQTIFAILFTDPELNKLSGAGSLERFLNSKIVNDIQKQRDRENWTQSETIIESKAVMKELMNDLRDVKDIIGGKPNLLIMLEDEFQTLKSMQKIPDETNRV